jgi:hypothetical protein
MAIAIAKKIRPGEPWPAGLFQEGEGGQIVMDAPRTLVPESHWIFSCSNAWPFREGGT